MGRKPKYTTEEDTIKARCLSKAKYRASEQCMHNCGETLAVTDAEQRTRELKKGEP